MVGILDSEAKQHQISTVERWVVAYEFHMLIFLFCYINKNASRYKVVWCDFGGLLSIK